MPKDDGWMKDANCADERIDPEIFFLKKYAQSANAIKIRKAKALCGACPVRQTCLKFALAHNIRDGIWGGMTIHERKRYFPRRVRLLVAQWWFKTHPGSYPMMPPGHYAPRGRVPVTQEEDDIAS